MVGRENEEDLLVDHGVPSNRSWGGSDVSRTFSENAYGDGITERKRGECRRQVLASSENSVGLH